MQCRQSPQEAEQPRQQADRDEQIGHERRLPCVTYVRRARRVVRVRSLGGRLHLQQLCGRARSYRTSCDEAEIPLSVRVAPIRHCVGFNVERTARTTPWPREMSNADIVSCCVRKGSRQAQEDPAHLLGGRLLLTRGHSPKQYRAG